MALAVSLALCAMQGHAEEQLHVAAADAVLPQVVVQGSSLSGASEGSSSYTKGAMSTATGLDLSVRDTPQSISIVTRQRIEDQAMMSVADALGGTIGISVKPVDRGRNQLSARGFDITNFQFDGIPMATGNIGIETGNTALYDRIEVVRGATGLLGGAGDPSAAVNLVRKHADSKTFTGSVSAQLGSWKQRTGTVDLSAPLNQDGSVRGRFVASVGKQDAFIDLEHTDNKLFYGVVDADLGKNTRLSVGLSDQRDQRNGVLWAGLPYWYADGSRTDWGTGKTTATRWNQWDTHEQTAFINLQHTLANRWTLRADVSHHRQNEDSKLLWMWGDPDRATGLGLQALPYHYISDPKQTQAGVSAGGPFQLFGRHHELNVGLVHSRLTDGWSNRDLVGDMAPLPDFNHWDGSYPEPAMGARYRGSRGTTEQSAVYAASRLQLTDALKAIVGGRVSNWQRKEEAAAWTASAYQIDHKRVFTPYAGLVYDLSPQTSAYASYTDQFKPQTSRDRNGNYLDPLEGKSYEAGLKGEFMDGKLNASAAVFRTEQSNFAVADVGYFVPGTTNPAFRTAQGVTVKGYEMEVNGDLARNLNLSVGWTRFSARDADGVDVAVDHARKQFKLFTKYTMVDAWRGVSFGAGVNWEGGRPASAVNPATGATEKVGQGAYALVDAMARYAFSDQLSLQLNLSNLTNKKYRSGSYWWGAPYTYGQPRKVLLTMDYRF
jgi:outer membrane receptor for ferric coprogen and ferric-rhodotorulic acid